MHTQRKPMSNKERNQSMVAQMVGSGEWGLLDRDARGAAHRAPPRAAAGAVT